VGAVAPAPDRTQRRAQAPTVGRHLAAVYGVAVTATTTLDAGVVHVARADGPDWVARVLPADRPVADAHGDVAILRALGAHGFPAERPATDSPVSALDGETVVVTEHVAAVPRERRRDAIAAAGGLRALGGLLGRLHAHPAGGAVTRPGGAWHHLADGTPADELAALRALLGDEHAQLRAAVDALPDGAALPTALVHPDFVLANVVAAREGGLVVVDWTGAGRGPRAWALAFTLWSAGFGGDLARVDRVAAGYRRHVSLEPEELDALPGLVRARPVVFLAWAAATGRRPAAAAVAELDAVGAAAGAIAARARAALA
jgi:Ser/Thr protein kinase RdoA (MazF antagonist)